MTDDSMIWLQGRALIFTRDPLDTHTHIHRSAGSGVGRLLINGSRSFAPSCLLHRAEGRSCSTRKIISAKFCSGFFFYPASMNMCIFTHNLFLCEGCRRCTMQLWVVTRSWSLCCWRPRQQLILKTTKVKNTQIFTVSLHKVHTRRGCLKKTNNHNRKTNTYFRCSPVRPIVLLYRKKKSLCRMQ